MYIDLFYFISMQLKMQGSSNATKRSYTTEPCKSLKDCKRYDRTASFFTRGPLDKME